VRQYLVLTDGGYYVSEQAQKGGKARRQRLRDSFVIDDDPNANEIETELDALRAQVEQLTEERDAAIEKLKSIRVIVAS
jgi:uncharacterized protein YfdQ (DUF2303 family)